MTLENGYMVREEAPCGTLVITYPDAPTFKDGNRVVIRWVGQLADGHRPVGTLTGTVMADHTIEGLVTSSESNSLTLTITMTRRE